MKQQSHPLNSLTGMFIVFILFVEVVFIHLLIFALVLLPHLLVYRWFGFEIAVMCMLGLIIVKVWRLIP